MRSAPTSALDVWSRFQASRRTPTSTDPDRRHPVLRRQISAPRTNLSLASRFIVEPSISPHPARQERTKSASSSPREGDPVMIGRVSVFLETTKTATLATRSCRCGGRGRQHECPLDCRHGYGLVRISCATDRQGKTALDRSELPCPRDQRSSRRGHSQPASGTAEPPRNAGQRSGDISVEYG